jgi:hypothetical protein
VAAQPRPARLSGLTRALGALLAGALLASCQVAAPPPVPKDAHVPDFARRPYEPFGRQAAVAIALREWRLFGQPVQEDAVAPDQADEDPEAKPERQPGLWQRVGEYWWLGMDPDRPERAWTGKHDTSGSVFPPAGDGRYAWSAAFISYVMRIAGAGPRFPYSERHATYINQAWRAAATDDPRWAVRALAPTAYPPQLGDLICFGRGDDRDLRFEDLPAPPFRGHCDVVVGREPERLAVIGGNVADAVTLKHVPTTPDGKLAAADGTVLDARYPWFVVIRVLYAR